MTYTPDESRYSNGMTYSFCGKSGLKLPKISLGFWHNFGQDDDFEKCKDIVHCAFDRGITHFDLANIYGPPAGTAEEVFGKIFKESLSGYRDEMVIGTKAGYAMVSGPYGRVCSRKNLITGLENSLKRLHTDFVDIFYVHWYDKETPLEETIQALVDIVKSGKALYVGLSKFPPDVAEKAYKILEAQNIHCLIHQGRYNLLTLEAEEESIETAHRNGVGFAAFSPLAQGILTDRYLNGIPADSRVAKHGFLKREEITPETIEMVQKLNKIALERGESLAQMSLSYLLSDERVSTVIVGASSVKQLVNNLGTLDSPKLSEEDKKAIRAIVR